jgi:hypothetical protein
MNILLSGNFDIYAPAANRPRTLDVYLMDEHPSHGQNPHHMDDFTSMDENVT